MSKCDTCINKKYCANHLDARTMCPQTDYVLFTPAYETHADRIRGMTDEELARWLANEKNCSWNDGFVGSESISENDLLVWLKSLVEGDNGT